MSRSLVLLLRDASVRILTAASWLHRFWAMTIPTAMSMMVRDSKVARRLAALSVCSENRTARRSAWEISLV
ncbi:hypothetical protein QFZ40_003489 [Arthrobacter pascens]|nr:hypothetical protein [Arthrobacter pascens]